MSLPLEELDWENLLSTAAELALDGEGYVEPNPLVGAVALRGRRIVGWGRHAGWGEAHAEENALSDARARGTHADTLVVTLEPCSSEGGLKKRPPCTRLLIEAGIRRVAIGCLDPDPRHAGAALGQLRDAGIEVVGPLPSPELETLLERFRRSLREARPWVVLKWAMTLDGKTATHTGSSRWISGELALEWAHRMRARSDAVLVGIGTALADDPELTVRLVAGDSPLRVVLDPAGELRPDCALLRSAQAVPVLVLRGESSARTAPELPGAEVVTCKERAGASGGRPELDVKEVLRLLGERSVRRLLVEGGGGVASQFFEAECYDSVECVVAPRLCGGREAFTPLRGLGIAAMEDAPRLHDLRTEQLGDCVLLRAFREARSDRRERE